MKNDAVGLLDYDYSTPQIPPKYVTFYRVFKEASENKRSSKPFGLIPFTFWSIPADSQSVVYVVVSTVPVSLLASLQP